MHSVAILKLCIIDVMFTFDREWRMRGNNKGNDPITKLQSANTVVTIGKCLMAYMQMFEETITLCGALHYFEELVPSDDDGSPLSLMGWS